MSDLGEHKRSITIPNEEPVRYTPEPQREKERVPEPAKTPQREHEKVPAGQ